MVTQVVTGSKYLMTENSDGSVTFSVPPPKGKLGAYPGSGNAAPGPFAAAVGPIAVVSRYEAVGFTVGAADAALVAGGQTLAYEMATRAAATWVEVTAGKLDAQITTSAKSIGALKVPVYVGYDNEWDGGAKQAEGGPMSTFAAAFERWSAIMRANAPNANLCCVPTGDNLTQAVAAAFPSADSYDVLCFDPYDPSLLKGSPLATWKPPFDWAAANNLGVGRGHGIFETGVANTVPDAKEAAWIAAMGTAAATLDLDPVIWFSADDTWPTIILPGTASAAAFKALSSSGYFA